MKPAPQSAEELYPAFPRSTPIYAVVDKSKKKPRGEKYLKDEKYFAPPVSSEPNLPDLVTLRADVRAPASRHASARKAREASASSAVSADDAPEDNDITEALTVTDNETVYLSDDTGGDTSALTTTEECSSNTDTNMVKSHSANNSPNIEDLYVVENLNKSKHHKKKKSKKKKDEELFPRDPANLERGGRISNGSKGRASLEPSRHVVSRNHVA